MPDVDPARLEHAGDERHRFPAQRCARCAAATAPIVVFCTTENDIAHIQEAIGAGANEYIMKPFDSDILQTKFAQVGLL